LATNLAGVYWDCWEKRRERLDQMKASKEQYDEILRHWLAEAQEKEINYRRSSGPWITYSPVEDYQITYLEKLTGSRLHKRKRVDSDEMGSSPVVKDEDLWKWN
jgi:tartrate dehydratase alpha subunit/fumarate hydratase class I-like protein